MSSRVATLISTCLLGLSLHASAGTQQRAEARSAKMAHAASMTRVAYHAERELTRLRQPAPWPLKAFEAAKLFEYEQRMPTGNTAMRTAHDMVKDFGPGVARALARGFESIARRQLMMHQVRVESRGQVSPEDAALTQRYENAARATLVHHALVRGIVAGKPMDKAARQALRLRLETSLGR